MVAINIAGKRADNSSLVFQYFNIKFDNQWFFYYEVNSPGLKQVRGSMCVF